MDNINNWEEITKGLYRYVISEDVAYELYIKSWYETSLIMVAIASAYIVSNGRFGDITQFRRDVIVEDSPVYECLRKVVEDSQLYNITEY